MEVDEASSLRLLGAENENAELRRRLELLQAEREVRARLQSCCGANKEWGRSEGMWNHWDGFLALQWLWAAQCD